MGIREVNECASRWLSVLVLAGVEEVLWLPQAVVTDSHVVYRRAGIETYVQDSTQ